MSHQCGMSSEKKINVFTKEACYPSSKNLVCVKKKKVLHGADKQGHCDFFYTEAFHS